MATSTINNPHVPGTVIAESTGNKTYANHLIALYSTYSALSQKERQRTAIVIGDDVYRAVGTRTIAAFSNTSGNTAESTIGIVSIRISSTSAQITVWDITTSGISKTSKGSETLNGTVQLVYGI